MTEKKPDQKDQLRLVVSDSAEPQGFDEKGEQDSDEDKKGRNPKLVS